MKTIAEHIKELKKAHPFDSYNFVDMSSETLTELLRQFGEEVKEACLSIAKERHHRTKELCEVQDDFSVKVKEAHFIEDSIRQNVIIK